jgi:hypothetical protein
MCHENVGGVDQYTLKMIIDRQVSFKVRTVNLRERKSKTAK